MGISSLYKIWKVRFCMLGVEYYPINTFSSLKLRGIEFIEFDLISVDVVKRKVVPLKEILLVIEWGKNAVEEIWRKQDMFVKDALLFGVLSKRTLQNPAVKQLHHQIKSNIIKFPYNNNSYFYSQSKYIKDIWNT